MRTCPLLLWLTLTACEDAPRVVKTAPPPRVYKLEELEWGHPAMGVMVESVAKHVAERHPDWVWNELQQDANYIEGGWTESPMIPPIDYAPKRRGGGHKVWFTFQLDRRATEAHQLVGAAELYIDEIASNGIDTGVKVSVWTGNTIVASNDSFLTANPESESPANGRLTVTPSYWASQASWASWLEARGAAESQWQGLHETCAIRLNLIAYALSSPAALQELGISAQQAQLSEELAPERYDYDPEHQQRGMGEIISDLSCPRHLDDCKRIDPYPIYAAIKEAQRMEELEDVRGDLTELQLEHEALYAALVEVVPPALLTEMARSTMAPAR